MDSDQGSSTLVIRCGKRNDLEGYFFIIFLQHEIHCRDRRERYFSFQKREFRCFKYLIKDLYKSSIRHLKHRNKTIIVNKNDSEKLSSEKL